MQTVEVEKELNRVIAQIETVIELIEKNPAAYRLGKSYSYVCRLQQRANQLNRTFLAMTKKGA